MAKREPVRELVRFCCKRLRRIADLAELAAQGPEPDQAAAHLRDFLSEYRELIRRLPPRK